MEKIYYDGDGYAILNNSLIIKWISEHKIEFRDNKLFVDIMVFKGTQLFAPPRMYTLPGMKAFRQAFSGVYLYEKDDVPYIDYDVEALKKFVGREDIDVNKVAIDFRHGSIINYDYDKDVY